MFKGLLAGAAVFLFFFLAFCFSFNVQAKASCTALFFNSKNPVLEWTHDKGLYPDLTLIKSTDLLDAQNQVFQSYRDAVNQVKEVEPPTFENTIEVLELASAKVKKFEGVWGLIDSAFKDDAYKKVEEDLLINEEKLSNETWMDPVLFDKIDAIYKTKDSLPEDQKRLVTEYRENFANNGLSLKGKEKERFIEIGIELSKLTSTFSNNLIESMGYFKLLIKNKEELTGLSESFIEGLRKKAEKEKLEGYLITLEPAIYTEVLKNAENRDLRKKIFIARGTVAYKSDKTDNEPVVKKIAELRQEYASLLGYEHYSEGALKNKMAKNLQTVRSLIDNLIDVYKPYAEKEEVELKEFVRSKTGKDDLESWDRPYWVEKLLKEKHAFDESVIKEYLEYNRVQQAAFEIAGRLYGLKFIPRNDLPKAIDDMQVFEVRSQDGELMSYFVVDPYARSGSKNQGAWAARLHPIYKVNGQRVIPISTNTMNFTKPEGKEPMLLTVNEGITLFHEFGHALHTILSQARYPSQSATAVARDFVELPSQFFENFFYQKEVLEMFAYHHKTNEFIPAQYIESIKKLSQFRSATAALRQLGFILIDLAWHDGSALKMKGSIYDIEQQVLKAVQIGTPSAETVQSTAFSHIFSGGYVSAYYSYKWAEILDADAFSIFKSKGLFNPEVANKFLVILQSGGSRDPADLYRDFAGREPSPKAMYDRDGVTPP